MGVAEDISAILAEKILDFKALIEAIQTGETVEAARARVLCGDGHPEENNRAHKDLFALALCTYQVVYNSDDLVKKFDGGRPGQNLSDTHYPGRTYDNRPKNTDPRRDHYFAPVPNYTNQTKYIGRGIDRQKVEKILGVQERKKSLDAIHRWRDVYGQFVQKDYFLQVLCFYLDNTDEHRLEGIARLSDQVLLLYNNPSYLDRHINLAKDFDTDDSWSHWVANLVSDDCPPQIKEFNELLVGEVTVKERLLTGALVINLSNKTARAVRAKLALHSRIAFETYLLDSKGHGPRYFRSQGQKPIQILRKRLSKIQVELSRGGVVSILEFGQHESIDLGRDALGKADNVRFRIYNRKELIEELEGVLSLRHERVTKKQAGKIKTRTGASPARHTLDAVVEDLRMIPEEQYKLNETNRVRFNERAMRVFNSKAFTGALSIMQIVNFTNAVYGLVVEIANNEKSREGIAKKLINTIGIGAQLSDSVLHFKRAQMLYLGKETAAISLNKSILQASIIGGTVSSVMCFWDGIQAVKSSDENAAAAWFGAGLSFGISAYVTYAAIVGPIGWIAMGAGIGFVALANMWVDSKLEKYFKYFLLSDYAVFQPHPKETPPEYSSRLLSNRSLLVKDSYVNAQPYLIYPSDALAVLLDLTVCSNVKYWPTTLDDRRSGTRHSWHQWIECMAFSINFNQFLTDACRVEVRLLLTHKDAIRCNYYREPQLRIDSKRVVQSGSASNMLSVDFGIPALFREEKFKNIRPILAIRINVDQEASSHFPYSFEGNKDRYLGFRIPLVRKINEGRPVDKSISTGTLLELKSQKIWE